MESPSWSVRVTAAGEAGVDVFARSERWRISSPVSFDRADRGLSALECLLGALGGDVVSGFMRLADQRRLVVDHAEALVRGQLDDPLAYLGAIGAEGVPSVGQVGVDVFVSSPADEGEIRAAWDEALARSPLANTFRVALQLDIRLTVTA